MCKQDFSLGEQIASLGQQIEKIETVVEKEKKEIYALIDQIEYKETIVEESAVKLAQANHFVGWIYNLIEGHSGLCGLFVGSCIGLFISYVLFFGHHLRKRSRKSTFTVKTLVCWACARAENLDTEIELLKVRAHCTAESSFSIKAIGARLTSHSKNLDDRIKFLVGEIEKCEWGNLLQFVIHNENFYISALYAYLLVSFFTFIFLLVFSQDARQTV